MDKYHIPKHLDQPFKIIIWPIDEFLALLVPILIGLMVLNSPIMGVMFGIVLMLVLKKIKGDDGSAFILRLAYWHIPNIVPYKAMPPSHLRVLLG